MTSKLEGKNCPKFNSDCTSGLKLSNKDFADKNLILYFYPKDSTPGCTTEGQDLGINTNLLEGIILKYLESQETR